MKPSRDGESAALNCRNKDLNAALLGSSYRTRFMFTLHLPYEPPKYSSTGNMIMLKKHYSLDTYLVCVCFRIGFQEGHTSVIQGRTVILQAGNDNFTRTRVH